MKKIDLLSGALSLALVVLLFGSDFVSAELFDSGRNSSDFVLMELDARPSALGGAYVAVADDLYAIRYNPAGLTNIKRTEFGVSYLSYVAEIDFGNIAFVGKIKKNFFYGFSSRGYYTVIEERDSQVLPLGKSEGSGNITTLSFASKFFQGLSFGVNAKIVYESLYRYKAQAIAGDLGMLYNLPAFGLNLGFSADNLFSTRMKFLDNSYSLPFSYRTGISRKILNEKLLIALSTQKTENVPLIWNLGWEYSLYNLLSLRWGYQLGQELGNLSAGIGIRFKPRHIANEMQIDYTILPLGQLGFSHRVSLVMRLAR